MAPNRTHRPNSARPRIPQKSGPVTTRTSKDGPEITLRQTADAWQEPFWASKTARDNASEEMGNVYTLAVANVSFLGVQISSACDSFKNFTESKIDDMDADDVTIGMVKAIFGQTFDLVKIMLPSSDGFTKLGKYTYEALQGAVRAMLEYPMNGVGEIDKDELKKVMRNFAESGRRLMRKWQTSSPGGASMQQIAPMQQFAGLVSRLQANLKSNYRRGMDWDQWTFLETFLDTEIDERNALLDHFYGIPSAENARWAALNLYKKIVHRFSKVYAWGASSKLDKLNQSQHMVSRIPTLAAQFESEAMMHYLR